MKYKEIMVADSVNSLTIGKLLKKNCQEFCLHRLQAQSLTTTTTTTTKHLFPWE